ncbi:hypothetical protein T439DRAFT_312777 [Meredithblackwellia eburnea MCA 4105]
MEGSVAEQLEGVTISNNNMLNLTTDDHDAAPNPSGLPLAGASSDDEGHADVDRVLGPEAPSPFFYPPLWLARRTSIVKTLRKEGVHSVGDFGCGSGALLQILIQPANSIDDYPALLPPSPYSTSPASDNRSGAEQRSQRGRKLDVLRSVPRPPSDENELHIRRLVALDINSDSLQDAIRITSPIAAPSAESLGEIPAAPPAWGSTTRERWENIRTEIWSGSLEVYNEAFDGLDAVVATEVIEHLTPTALNKFSSVVLGVYQPRIVIVTTPNHDFNPYFIASSSEEEAAHRFLDPSGRTSRVFRDSDHQFEFTQDEFKQWADQAASDNDYRVSYSGVGSLKHYFGKAAIPFPPPSLAAHPELQNSQASIAIPSDPAHFFATQIAVFTRQYPNEPERSPRSHRTAPLPFFSPVATPAASLPTTPATQHPPSPVVPLAPAIAPHRAYAAIPHKLLKSTTHRAIEQAGKPASAKVILSEAASLLNERFYRADVVLRDLWNQSGIRVKCGGTIASLVEAVTEHDDWDVRLVEGCVGDLATEIIWNKWKPDPRPSSEENGGADTDEDDEDSEPEPVAHYLAGGVEANEWAEEDNDWGVRTDITTGASHPPGMTW